MQAFAYVSMHRRGRPGRSPGGDDALKTLLNASPKTLFSFFVLKGTKPLNGGLSRLPPGIRTNWSRRA